MTFTVGDNFIFIEPSSPPAETEDDVNEGFAIEPGQMFAGWTYQELRQLGDGTHDIVPKTLGIVS